MTIRRSSPPVPFHVPTMTEDEIDAVVSVLRSGWITTGPRCRAFEDAFAAFLTQGAEREIHAVAVNSATAALHLALEAVGVGADDLVLTTPFTFTATSGVIRHLGAHPVFVDVDPVTGNICAEQVEAVVETMSERDRMRIRALVPVHFAGLSCDMTALCGLAERHGWAVVDDAAHALPSRHAGEMVGTLGSATAFSFYATKPLSTGEGGMLVTPDAAVAQRARRMRLHGIDRDVFDRYQQPNSWYYEVVAPGFKCNMTDLAAALGLSQLARVQVEREQRAAIAATYTAELAGTDGLAMPPDAQGTDQHSWHLFALKVADGRPLRDALIRELGDAGIGTSVHFIPLHLQPYFRDAYELRPQDYPMATRLFEQELSLPIFPTMSEDQVRRVVDEVPRALGRARALVGPTRRTA